MVSLDGTNDGDEGGWGLRAEKDLEEEEELKGLLRVVLNLFERRDWERAKLWQFLEHALPSMEIEPHDEDNDEATNLQQGSMDNMGGVGGVGAAAAPGAGWTLYQLQLVERRLRPHASFDDLYPTPLERGENGKNGKSERHQQEEQELISQTLQFAETGLAKLCGHLVSLPPVDEANGAEGGVDNGRRGSGGCAGGGKDGEGAVGGG